MYVKFTFTVGGIDIGEPWWTCAVVFHWGW